MAYFDTDANSIMDLKIGLGLETKLFAAIQKKGFFSFGQMGLKKEETCRSLLIHLVGATNQPVVWWVLLGQNGNDI